MIHAGAGMSLRPDSKRAAEEALDEAMGDLAGSATALVLCATSHHASEFPDILRLIRERVQVRALFGGTGTGIVGPRGEVEHAPAISILAMTSDRLTAAAAVIPDLQSPDAVEQLRSELPSLYRERGTLMVLADPRSMDPDFLSRLAQAFPETPIIGAAAGWCSGHSAAAVAADGEFSAHGGAAMHLAGCIEPAIGVAHAVVPEGIPKPVTRAGGNHLIQIESEPAADFLASFVSSLRGREQQTGKSPVDIYCAFANSPSDFTAGRYIVRNIMAVEPASKHVVISETVRAGQYICFALRSAKGARRSFRQMLERLNGAMASRVPRAAILFNCCARGHALYGRSHVDLEAYREFFPELPVAGLFGFAEIGPIFWSGRKVRSAILNHTAVLTILTEPMEALGAA